MWTVGKKAAPGGLGGGGMCIPGLALHPTPHHGTHTPALGLRFSSIKRGWTGGALKGLPGSKVLSKMGSWLWRWRAGLEAFSSPVFSLSFRK